MRSWRPTLVLVAVAAVAIGPGALAKSKVPRATVSFPTFQLGSDGRTTLAMRVSQSPEVEESSPKGHYLLRLKNARIGVRNDAHVLHAEHFESAVLEARLKAAGNDVLFDVTLRSDVTPVRSVRAVTAEERAEEPHKEASSAEVVVTLEFPSAPAPAQK
jgi:hypothetical protein